MLLSSYFRLLHPRIRNIDIIEAYMRCYLKSFDNQHILLYFEMHFLFFAIAICVSITRIMSKLLHNFYEICLSWTVIELHLSFLTPIVSFGS